jgi:amidohydrolase
MNAIDRIKAYAEELTATRRDFHAHPEIGFEEVRTSGIVAEKLASWGVEVHRGVGKTGVVGIIEGNGRPGASIGLRADMDALPIEEATDVAWKSTKPGTMHACGHDGHTTMLLGAARYLAETRDFPGRVVCIFQPAEEGLGGARAMLADGLFERFPCQEIYGLHNTPSGPRNEVSIRSGPAMAAADFFDIHITGRGSHGALPQQSIDPTMVAVSIAQAMQTIVSRNVDPLRSAVVSITQIHAGAAYNVVPETARLAGTVRCFDEDVRQLVRRRVEEIARGIASGFGAQVEIDYRDIFSVTMNSPQQTDAVLEVAHEIVGRDMTRVAAEPMMGSEDFADMLHQVPGAYFFLGMSPGASLHNAAYTFDDAILPVGDAGPHRGASHRGARERGGLTLTPSR